MLRTCLSLFSHSYILYVHIGAITVEDVLTMLPFENVLYECRYPGSTLRAAAEQSVSTYDRSKANNYLPYFLYFSGTDF